jgi:hypothetical protein
MFINAKFAVQSLFFELQQIAVKVINIVEREQRFQLYFDCSVIE